MTPKTGNRRQAAIAFILVTLFIDILGIGVIVPVLPELVKELLENDTSQLVADSSGETLNEVSPSTQAALPASESSVTESKQADSQAAFVRAGRYVGVIAASYALMQFFFAPIMGAFSDRFGRRPIILFSLFGLGIDFLIQGFAQSIGWLFAGRLIAGIMGASFTTANAYIADVSTDDTRARNFGLVGMMFGLGFTIGPALGGLLGTYSLRAPFFVAAGLALINWLYGYFVLPESLPPEKRSELTLRHISPLSSITRLGVYPIVAGLAIIFACKSLAQRGLENVWVLYTAYRYDWDERTNGLALGLVGICAIVVQGGLVRPTIKRLGERKTVIFGTIIATAGFLGYGFASEGWMVPWIIIMSSVGGLAGPAIQSLVTSTVDESEQGKIQGALTSLTSLTNIIAPVLFNTVLFSYFISDKSPIQLPGAPFFVGAVLIGISTMVAIVVFRRFPSEETTV